MLHFNHGSKQEANEGNASALATQARRCAPAGAVLAGAGAPKIPTPPEDISAELASTLPTIADQTANLGSSDWRHFSR